MVIHLLVNKSLVVYVYYSDTAVKWSQWSLSVTDGLKIPIPSSAIEMFFLFFTSSLMNYIVNLTNQFALECMGEEKFAKWTQVTVEELQALSNSLA